MLFASFVVIVPLYLAVMANELHKAEGARPQHCHLLQITQLHLVGPIGRRRRRSNGQ